MTDPDLRPATPADAADGGHLDEHLVGFVGTRPSCDPDDAALGELDTIAVAPAYRRAGIGRLLMTAALHALADAGHERAVLWTLADHPRGHAFYRATGWEPSGASRADGSEVAFARDLTTPRR